MRFGYTHAHFTDPIGTFEHSNYDMEDALVALIAGANTTIRLLSYSLPTWNRDWFLFDPIEACHKSRRPTRSLWTTTQQR